VESNIKIDLKSTGGLTEAPRLFEIDNRASDERRLQWRLAGMDERFEGNLMTWVYPSNGKLIDRAARYTGILLRARLRPIHL
jgi:hypothetical protein